jgi:hypothetical protein
MSTDLEQIEKPLSAIIKAQIESPTEETEMYFYNIHLSPLKVRRIESQFHRFGFRFM